MLALSLRTIKKTLNHSYCKLSDKENLKAIIDLIIGDWEMRGFRLSISKYENDNLDGKKLFLQPPSLPRYSNMQIIRVNNKEVWRKLERLVYEKYTQEQANNSKEEESENLWID